MDIRMMEAGYGDCFWIRATFCNGKPCNILIDSGTAHSYSFKNEKKINRFLTENVFDFIIITHTDDDHIKGFSRLFHKLSCDNSNGKNKVKRVIYNSPYAVAKHFGYSYRELKKSVIQSSDTSASSADDIQQKLFDLDLLENNIVINDGSSDINQDGIKITFLSPTVIGLKEFYKKYLKSTNKNTGANTKGMESNNDYDSLFDDLKEDTSVDELDEINYSSIAFLIEEAITGHAILMLGDSDYNIVRTKLSGTYSETNKLKLNCVKLSHHGSICTLSGDFLHIIDCDHYLISTDGSMYQHPDKKTLARIWKHNDNATFYFNYPERIDAIFKNEPNHPYKKRCIERKDFNDDT